MSPEFYDHWERAHLEDKWAGIFHYEIHYVCSPETEKLDPNYVVTPSDAVIVPHYWTAAAALLVCAPLAFITLRKESRQ
jgi:hypothetical protein